MNTSGILERIIKLEDKLIKDKTLNIEKRSEIEAEIAQLESLSK